MTSDLKKKLSDQFGFAPVFGCWTSFSDPSSAEILADSGVDFVGIDMEHTTISLEQAKQIIVAAQSRGAACLPRVASHQPETIARLLDAGADGIIIPRVTSAAEVSAVAAAVKYPPEGKRGIGIARAQSYGFEFDNYVSDWNHRSILLIQIETMDGVSAADSLLANPHVDGAMVGLYDLSGSLGIPGKLDDPRVLDASSRVLDSCRARRKACGIHITDPTPEKVASAAKAGYAFIVLGSDLFVLAQWAERIRAQIKPLRSS